MTGVTYPNYLWHNGNKNLSLLTGTKYIRRLHLIRSMKTRSLASALCETVAAQSVCFVATNPSFILEQQWHLLMGVMYSKQSAGKIFNRSVPRKSLENRERFFLRGNVNYKYNVFHRAFFHLYAFTLENGYTYLNYTYL